MGSFLGLYCFGAAQGEWTACLNQKMTCTGSRDQSSSDDKCPQCKNKVAENNLSLCNGCLEWWHGTTGGIEVKDLAILAKYSAVHWYCTNCENKCFQKQDTTILKSLVTLNQRQNAEIEISEQTTDLFTSLKNDIQSVKQKQTEKLKSSEEFYLQK